MAAVPFIGSKISLVSKADLRYEGTLFTIDPANSTVSLSNVVCFGTEERLPEVIPGSDTVYPFLIFKGADIKNLYVIEDVDPSARSQSAPPNDPAIIGTTAPARSPNAAVIAAAKAKSEAERSDKLLAQQMSQASISGTPDKPSHQAVFPPRPIMPAGQYGYGYQPQGMWYPPATAAYASLQNHPAMYPPPMPYPPMPYAGSIPQSDSGQLHSLGQQPPQQVPQASSRFRNEPALAEAAPVVRHLPQKIAGVPRPSSVPSPRESKYADSIRLKSNIRTQQGPERPVTAAEQAAIPATEFDFQSSNARFDKESFIKNLNSPHDQNSTEAHSNESAENGSPAAQSVAKKYDKTASFFDDISLDRDERGRKENRRGQNEETFGTMAAGFTSSTYRRNYNRNRRGRSGNSTRRNDRSDNITPHSPIRRDDQSRPRGSPRNGDRKAKNRRGRRPNNGNPDNNQEVRNRNSGRRSGAPATGASGSSQTV